MTAAEMKARIDKVIGSYQQKAGLTSTSVLSQKAKIGKVYEALALCEVLKNLSAEGFEVVFVGGSVLTLKAAPGPINREYPYFEATRRHDGLRLEVWTDVEFLSLSHETDGGGPQTRGDFHELDILVTFAGIEGRPQFKDVAIAVECKAARFTKGILREVLGVRRELSVLPRIPISTLFSAWPAADVNASPPSCLVVYCMDPRVREFARPGDTFSINFELLP
jgi:hypothetical protein